MCTPTAKCRYLMAMSFVINTEDISCLPGEADRELVVLVISVICKYQASLNFNLALNLQSAPTLWHSSITQMRLWADSPLIPFVHLQKHLQCWMKGKSAAI